MSQYAASMSILAMWDPCTESLYNLCHIIHCNVRLYSEAFTGMAKSIPQCTYCLLNKPLPASWLATHGADLLGADLCGGWDPTEPSFEAIEQLPPSSGLEASRTTGPPTLRNSGEPGEVVVVLISKLGMRGIFMYVVWYMLCGICVLCGMCCVMWYVCCVV